MRMDLILLGMKVKSVDNQYSIFIYIFFLGNRMMRGFMNMTLENFYTAPLEIENYHFKKNL